MEPWEIVQQKRLQDLRKAMDVLETLPGFPAAQVQRYEGEKDALKILAADNPPLGSETRLEHILKLLDIRTRPYLELVTNMLTLKAFTGLISEFANVAWEEQTGGPFYQQGIQFDRIETKVRDWVNEAYRRVAQGTKTTKTAISEKSERQFREPNMELLKNPDITLNRQAAAEALGISTRTLDRLATDGTLPRTGLGARKRFRVKDLKRLLDQRNMDKRDRK